MRDFRELIPGDPSDPNSPVSKFRTYLRDRLESSHRKPHATIYVWDPKKNGTGAYEDLSQYGFEASINIADVFSKNASSATLTAVDPSKHDWNPFYGAKKHLLERGNRIKIELQEKDLPTLTIGGIAAPFPPIPIFEGVILDASYTLSRQGKSAKWEIDCQVRNYQRYFKQKISTRAFYPLHTVDTIEANLALAGTAYTNVVYLPDVDAAGKTMTAHYSNGMEIYLDGDKYTVSVARATTSNGTAYLALDLTTRLKRDYPAGTLVKKAYATSIEETDVAYIAREILKSIGYADAMKLSDDDLKLDIPDTVKYRTDPVTGDLVEIPGSRVTIQNKFQVLDEELAIVLEKLLICAGRFPYVRPSDGRIVSIDVGDRLRRVVSAEGTPPDPHKTLSSDVVNSLTFNTDSSALINRFRVKGLSPNMDISEKSLKTIFKVNGTIGWWSGNGKPEEGLAGLLGMEYLSWRVYGSEDRKVRIRSWALNPRETSATNWAMFPRWVLIPKDEFECELRLYFNNNIRKLLAGVQMLITASLVAWGLKVFLETTANAAGGIPIIGGAVEAVINAGKIVQENIAFLNTVANITTMLTAMLSVSDYKAEVMGIPYELYYVEIASTASLGVDIINKEGEALEEYENHVISTYKMASYVAQLWLALKRSLMTRVSFNQIYDYEIESGDILGIEVAPDQVEYFVVGSINFSVQRGETLTARYNLQWLDPNIKIESLPVTIAPDISVRQCLPIGDYTQNSQDPEEEDGVLMYGNRTKVTILNGGGPDGGEVPLPVCYNIPSMNEKDKWLNDAIEVRIKNHMDIYESVQEFNNQQRALGRPEKKLAYVYAYSTLKDMESPSTVGYGKPVNELSPDEKIREATPHPTIFNSIAPTSMTYGVGLKRYAANDTTLMVSGDVLLDGNGNPQPFATAAVMFFQPGVEAVNTGFNSKGVKKSYKKQFKVAGPLPRNAEPSFRKFFIRVGVVELDAADQPIWHTLVLSNSVQIQVNGLVR